MPRRISFGWLSSIISNRTIFRQRKKHHARREVSQTIRLNFESLEERRLLAVTLQGGGTWVEQGPGVIINGQTEGIADNPVVGAVQAVAVDEVQGKIYVGTVNGGVWSSGINTQIGPSKNQPLWTPQTDGKQSLSIGAIAISPDNNQLVVAGTGSFSNGAGKGGRSIGVYVTEDGGANWEIRGKKVFESLPIRSIAITREKVNNVDVDAIFVGTNSGAAGTFPGLYVSFDRGVKWQRLSGSNGLPGSAVSDIEIDPGVSGDATNPKTYYAGVPNQGIYSRTAGSATWTKVRNLPSSGNILLSVHRRSTTQVLYAGVVTRGGSLLEVVRSTDRGVSWTNHGNNTLPTTNEVVIDGIDNDGDTLIDTADTNGGELTANSGLITSGQGIKNFSLVASKRNPNIVYVGGDVQPAITGNVQGCNNFTGRLFSGDLVGWQSINCTAASGTSPHADTRFLSYLEGSGGVESDILLETDDGGIYALANPENAPAAAGATKIDRKWFSINGTTQPLRITEVNSVAYDHVNDTFFIGNQDTGTAEQPSSGKITRWEQAPNTASSFMSGDGQIQLFAVQDGKNVHYSMSNTPEFFFRREYTKKADGTLDQTDLPALNGVDYKSQKILAGITPVFAGTAAKAATNAAYASIGPADAAEFQSGFDTIPMVFNRFKNRSKNMLWGHRSLYESTTSGTTNVEIEDWTTTVGGRDAILTAVAYGGRGVNGSGVVVDSPEVIYAARNRNIAVRQAGAKILDPLSNPNGFDLPSKSSNAFDSVRDIVMNPDEWRIAYAIDSRNIYRTKDGSNGTEWVKLNKGNLSSLTSELWTINIYNPTSNPNDEIVLVAGRGGVFYSFDAKAEKPIWRELAGSGARPGQLPNAVVNDLHVDQDKDIIFVGTYGRGVYRLNNAHAAFSGRLVIEGTTGADTIKLRLSDSSSNPALEVDVNGTIDLVPYSILDSIKINALAGNDKIIIDSSNGLLNTDNVEYLPAFIEIDGNTGSNEIELRAAEAVRNKLIFETAPPDPSGKLGFQLRTLATRSNPSRYMFVKYSNVATVDPTQIPSKNVAKLGFALEKLKTASVNVSAKGGNLAFGNVVQDLSGATLRDPGPVPALSNLTATVQGGFVREGLGEIAGQFFQSLSFAFEDIGDEIADENILRARLDDLDAETGNVGVSTVDGVVRLDVEINKQLSGLSRFDLGIQEGVFAGLASLRGGLQLTADATMRVVIGIDAQGKIFIDPNGAFDANNNPIPFIEIANIQGSADGSGRLGMFDVNLKSATITTDSDLKVHVGLVDPNPDDAEPFLRLPDLDLENGEIFSVGMTSSPDDNEADVSIAGTFDVKVFDTTLFADRQLTFQWPDALNPRNGLILPGGDASLFNSLAAGIDQITSGITALADAIEEATGNNILSMKVPLLNKTLGEILNQQSEPVVIALTPEQIIDPLETDAETGESRFRVRTAVKDLLAQGLEIGGDVSYQSTGGATVIGTLHSFGRSDFVVSYTGTADAKTPSPGTTFSLPRAGGLSARLRTLTGGVAVELPTVQELLDHIAGVTGIKSIRNVQVVGTLGQPNFGIQFPIQYVPEPITYPIPLDFAEKIASLKLEASALAQIVVQPSFNITVGISLAAKKADGTDFSALERVFVVASSDPNPITGSAPLADQPIVGVNVTLQLDNPSLKGSVGFLDVTLAETGNPATNKGIKLDLLGSIHLVDPDTGAADQRISLKQLGSNLTNIVDFDFDGSLDIDGLTAAASVGTFGSLAGVTIALEGEGGDSAPGHFESLAELGQVLSRIQVGSLPNSTNSKILVRLMCSQP
jgi:hypothetical protein